MSTRRNVLVTALVTVSLLAAFAGPATAGRSFSHRMTGEAEVPGPGDMNGRGRFTITVFPERHELCYRLHWEAIASPMMAHVHKGRADVAGPVRVTLFSQRKPLPDSIQHRSRGASRASGPAC